MCIWLHQMLSQSVGLPYLPWYAIHTVAPVSCMTPASLDTSNSINLLVHVSLLMSLVLGK